MTDLTPNPTPAPESGERQIGEYAAMIRVALYRADPYMPSYPVGVVEPVLEHIIAALTSEIASLKQRLESAEGALDKFGKHDGLCARIGGYGYCNCGLEDALQHQEKQNG